MNAGAEVPQPDAMSFALSREQHRIFPEDAAFALAARRFGPVLRRVARRMDGVDPDLADDLVQEALIRLWELGPSRYDAGDDVYVRNRLIGRMRDARRSEARRGRRCDLSLPMRLV